LGAIQTIVYGSDGFKVFFLQSKVAWCRAYA